MFTFITLLNYVYANILAQRFIKWVICQALLLFFTHQIRFMWSCVVSLLKEVYLSKYLSSFVLKVFTGNPPRHHVDLTGPGPMQTSTLLAARVEHFSFFLPSDYPSNYFITYFFSILVASFKPGSLSGLTDSFSAFKSGACW